MACTFTSSMYFRFYQCFAIKSQRIAYANELMCVLIFQKKFYFILCS